MTETLAICSHGRPIKFGCFECVSVILESGYSSEYVYLCKIIENLQKCISKIDNYLQVEDSADISMDFIARVKSIEDFIGQNYKVDLNKMKSDISDIEVRRAINAENIQNFVEVNVRNIHRRLDEMNIKTTEDNIQKLSQEQ